MDDKTTDTAEAADIKTAAVEMWHKLELTNCGKPNDFFDVPTEEEFLEAGSDFLPVGESIKRFYKALLYEFPEFGFLVRANVKLLWKLKGGKGGGNLTLGKLQKPSGLLRHFSDCDYAIWFAADHCREFYFTNW